ncbi:S8 family serine peptidase [Arthrobacter citreus]|nr:S8 family serine peptidase [Arthrobacter citreus]
MRKTSKRKMKHLASIGLSTSLLFGTLAPITYHANAQTISSSEVLLAKLTPEQREALQALNSNKFKTGLHLSSDINLSSPKEVSVIVEFKVLPAKTEQLTEAAEGKSISLATAMAKVEQSHVQFKKDLQEQVGNNAKSKQDSYQIKHTYKHSFNGVALTLPANQIKQLMQLDGVKAVYSDAQVQLQPPKQTDEKNDQTNVDSIPFLKVDELHKEGFTGKGVKIGVIDTGIDYNHPDLKGAYKGGYDFVDNDNDPMETTYDNWKKSGNPEFYNGSSYYTEHGTHVSGTIAGQAKNDSNFKVTGIAPDADLYVYRVLGPYGSGANSSVIAGIDKSVEDGMDVINLSLGSDYNDPLDPTSLAIDNAVLNGVTAVVAAGNSGDYGMSTLGSPGAAALALTVGASSASTKVTTFKSSFKVGKRKINGTLQLMTKKWTDDFSNLSSKSFDIVNVGEGGPNDYAGKDVKGKIALVVRGTYALIDKMQYAKQNGAAGIIIYNNNFAEGQIPYYLGESNDYIPVFSLDNNTGSAVRDLLQTGTMAVSFGTLGESEISGDVLADFSSRGPSGTLYDIKPEVTAPGVNVLSTVPSYIRNKNDQSDYSSAYERMSGTSMATPHVAGIAALLLQANPNYTPAIIKTILMNTADPLKDKYSVFEVGAGRVDPYEAIHSDTEISVSDETPYIDNGQEQIIQEQTGGLSYGIIPMDDDTSYNNSKKIIISNSSKKTKKYTVSVEYNIGAQGSLDAQKNGVNLIVSENSLKLKSDSQKEISVLLSIPKTAEKGTYEGYIHIENEKNPEENYQIPFGTRVVEEGFKYFKVHSPSISTNRVIAPFSVKDSDLDFNFNSPMKTIDFVLVDPKTNKDLGLITSINTTGATVDYEYYLQDGFTGRYFPFTGNAKKPIGFTSILAPEGVYKIKAIGTNQVGKQFVQTDKVYIDNSGAKLSLDQTNATPKGNLPFVELAPDQKTVTLSGTVIDNEVTEMQNNGINVTQANNKVYYGSNGPALSINVDENGKFSKEISVTGSSTATMLQFVGADRAGNTSNAPRVIYYVKAGTQYIYAKPNKESITMGDKVTYTLYSHGLKNAKEMSFSLNYLSKYFDSAEIVKNIALPEGTELTSTTNGTTSLTTNITLKMPNEGISGDVPLLDLVFDTKADEYVNVLSQLFNIYGGAYKDVNGATVRPLIQTGLLPIYASYSKVQAQLGAQGLYKEDGTYNYSTDYTTVGATVKAQDSKGNLYAGEIQKNGQIFINNLPANEPLFTVIVDVPGHFTTYTPLEVGRQDGNISIGESIFYYTAKSKAGDINKDNVVDLNDVLLLEANWNKNNRNTDINFDGITDAKDFKLLESNYLKENDYVLNTPSPVQVLNGQTIQTIKAKLGVN